MAYANFILILLAILYPDAALATQAHGEPEGIYAHQFAHLFFMVSMVILIYWLRQKKLTRISGWRYIQFAAFFFILWNLNVIWVHFLDEQTTLVSVEKTAFWQIKIHSTLGSWAAVSYYIGKMDHLFCVPALFCLFVGLKKLENGTKDARKGPIQ